MTIKNAAALLLWQRVNISEPSEVLALALALTSLLAIGLVAGHRVAAHVPVDVGVPAVAVAAAVILFKVTLWRGEKSSALS